MRNVLVFGAGHSATYLIRYLLARAEERDGFVTVVDRDPELARQAVDEHSRGDAVALDVRPTAMSRTVGLPAGIAAERQLAGELPLNGCQVPTHPAIYAPILHRLEAEGLAFDERVETLDGKEGPR
jgi:saccharopine dehydrogenase-like NADP-dependent oxidoreductase